MDRCTCRFFLQDLARGEGGRCLGIKVNKTLSLMPRSHLDQEAGGDGTVTKEREYRRESDGEEQVQEQTPRTETRCCLVQSEAGTLENGYHCSGNAYCLCATFQAIKIPYTQLCFC